MLTRIFFSACLLFFAGDGMAQVPQTDTVSKNAVRQLAFITGQWKGEGWMLAPNGTKYTFMQTENVQFKLDSTALLIEGLGKSGERIIHNAMAVISFNKEENNYSFQSFLATGRKGSFRAEMIGNKLYWYPGNQIRYIIYLNEKGQWYESGERKTGNEWVPFFEMVLDKVN